MEDAMGKLVQVSVQQLNRRLQVVEEGLEAKE
jgi:hypothetical protein